MAAIKFRINDKIEIIDKNITYKSNVHDVHEKTVLIDMPISGNNYYMMHQGSELIFYYCAEDKNVYKCKSVVLGKKMDNNLQFVLITYPEVLEKIQRREYFRLPVAMEIKYYFLPENRVYNHIKDVPIGYFDRMQRAVTIDISGGGIKFVTREAVMKNTNVIIKINLFEEIILLCTVVRVEKDDETNQYKIGLRFDSIDERIREKIIRFIFQKLREQNRLLR
ncbi:hypothetical protein Q428_06120 [Fervidicella metallireducens AeB]|uniref:Pilus assembly protein PilZ n=1 Tax=Fervidicella metallireducens AeB TaxID=1403537 RepID=A0A017RVM5_9CLOT|nr:PilZ domain-containing protein [Fervidicella metallireducens]EYE88833.1 hypothetical protein Q428_06120 [Fervidicella metallireducens AeB]